MHIFWHASVIVNFTACEFDLKDASKPELSKKERKQFNRLKCTFREAAEHRRAWKRACKIVRDHFIAHIRKLAPNQ
jgi:hypothetical protein